MAEPGGERSSTLPHGRLRRPGRWLPVVLVGCGWLAVVAISAGGRPSDGSWVGVPDLSSVVIWFVLAGALVGLVLLSQIRASGYAQGRPTSGIVSMLAATIAIMAVVALLMDDDVNDSFSDLLEEQEVEESVGDLDSGRRSRLPDSTTGVGSRDVTVGLVLAAAAAVTGLALARRKPAPADVVDGNLHGIGDDATAPTDGDRLAHGLVAATEYSRDLIDSIIDPRLAIMTAYSHVEQALGKLSQQRLLHETASEHMERVLGTQAIERRALLGLADLYEHARFSSRPLTSDDRSRALSYLDDAIEQLSVDVNKLTGEGERL